MTKKQSSHVSLWFLTGAAAGAAIGSLLTYFFDPGRGSYRRAKLVDKSVKFTNDSLNSSGKLMRHFKNQARGLKTKASHVFSKEAAVDDSVLEARIRSKFGRKVSHTKAIKTYVQDGIVTLSGPILAKEVKELLSAVKSVEGVRRVINCLDIHQSAEKIPDLQGPGPAYLQG